MCTDQARQERWSSGEKAMVALFFALLLCRAAVTTSQGFAKKKVRDDNRNSWGNFDGLLTQFKVT